jgi:hypothetical protein
MKVSFMPGGPRGGLDAVKMGKCLCCLKSSPDSSAVPCVAQRGPSRIPKRRKKRNKYMKRDGKTKGERKYDKRGTGLVEQ